ncbi:transcriptional regulator, TetR family protein [Stappia aggregata IAM 12614]|uniref:Transcriptional regulator, TetR family protein n=1 Tax=Roseibium aggregatum (strain ATCC 25650 / DSM 13394 / JCM 20685 / NBRC 16684 / NCIMB 2208 / IAM 12614 / B1) TaxID=384765 RepID=A0NMK3_ROSAI|nr:TetR/AcrR family transcriptional regulator [Roseibium aggregatum]EAV46298.1 transcriptional regulator, TetR family protein [Stappia aggregata IAM 12614] [Roseibium aggregatum IAM 12614]
MRAEARERRKTAIETAAIELLLEEGYDNMSMLAVARKAKASNETLYRWYGDKTGLFAALVDRNAEDIRLALKSCMGNASAPEQALKHFGRSLLGVLTNPAAIALNRAAAADTTGTLGAALARSGRNAVLPLVQDLIAQVQDQGFLADIEMAAAAELYLSLLIGDLQIRLVTRALPQLPETDIDARVDSAWHAVRLLSGGNTANAS